MNLKDLKKGNSVVTTPPEGKKHENSEICYVHVGRDMVGVGVFFDESDDCVAAIITDEGKKKLIGFENQSQVDDTIKGELEEAYGIFNDQ